VVKRAGGWLWMGGAIAAVIALQLLRQSPPLAWFDGVLNGARDLIPAGIAITVIGAALLIGAAVHGMVFDAARMQPGNIEYRYSRRTPMSWQAGWFKGRLLWGGEFHEESGFRELKLSWRTGEWLTDHRYLRATMVMLGLPLAMFGAFGTIALVTNETGVRLLLILALAYVAARLGYALAKA
jgi:hypothetical protein